MDYDHAYKRLFAGPELVADLLREFIREPWVQALDLSTLERVSASFVSTDLRNPGCAGCCCRGASPA